MTGNVAFILCKGYPVLSCLVHACVMVIHLTGVCWACTTCLDCLCSSVTLSNSFIHQKNILRLACKLFSNHIVYSLVMGTTYHSILLFSSELPASANPLLKGFFRTFFFLLNWWKINPFMNYWGLSHAPFLSPPCSSISVDRHYSVGWAVTPSLAPEVHIRSQIHGNLTNRLSLQYRINHDDP